ncbi:MAG: hypothetical protein QW303_01500 [Nitrososphaerota archaeon]
MFVFYELPLEINKLINSFVQKLVQEDCRIIMASLNDLKTQLKMLKNLLRTRTKKSDKLQSIIWSAIAVLNDKKEELVLALMNTRQSMHALSNALNPNQSQQPPEIRLHLINYQALFDLLSDLEGQKYMRACSSLFDTCFAELESLIETLQQLTEFHENVKTQVNELQKAIQTLCEQIVNLPPDDI